MTYRILTYQHQYVKYRVGKCKDFGTSRSTVVFLNIDLSNSEVTLLSGESYHTTDGEVYWQSFSFLLSGRIEGCQTGNGKLTQHFRGGKTTKQH